MRLKLHIWRQTGPDSPGALKAYEVTANEHMSFLEMLDVLNQDLIEKGEEPVAFEHDCREGICGTCNMGIN
ncbi:MAG: 2Fe-2S iron-sulfur cluster-binding protein, partial [Planctomycetota bacterium]